LVIPIADDNPTRRTPVVTLLLIAINVGVFVFAQPWSADACTQQAFFVEWAAVPEEIVSGEPMSPQEVAVTTPPGCGVGAVPDKSVYLSVVSAMFLHAGWAHLLGNMLFLWIFGNNVEDQLGRARFLLFYLASGIVATVAFVLPNARSLTTLVGASGAVAGVLGAYIVMFPRRRITVFIPPLFFLPFRLPALVMLGGWFVLQLLSGRVADMSGGGVAYLAHVAGFIAGIVITLALGFRPERRRRRPAPWELGPPQPGWGRGGGRGGWR